MIVFPTQAAVNPVGNPVAVPIPVAPVVVCVMFVMAALIQTVGVDDAAPTDMDDRITVIVPVALVVPQPPVNGIS